MVTKRAAPFDIRSMRITDNVPAGMAVSLEGIAPAASFASMFRDELMARGIGTPKKEARRGGKRLA